jgi:glycosyltransferase involved in cell wall biosynthesis
MKDYEAFINNGCTKTNIHLIQNGSNEENIIPVENKQYAKKSMYLAKIEWRKQQHIYKQIPNIDFYGRCDESAFKQLECYKGEPERNTLIKLIPEYGNLVLLSIGENGTPLVIKEALMAGLPVVTNKYSTNDLHPDLPFIDIIPDDKLNDLEYVKKIIYINLAKQFMKDDIRKYAIDNFTWKKIMIDYVNIIKS